MAEWIWRRFASLSAFAAAAATVRGTWLRAAIVAGLAAASLAAGPAFAQLSPVTISKSFGAGSIPLGGTTSLSFTISNATGPGFSTNIAFTDNLPAGLVVATPSGLTIPDNTVTGCDGGIATATAGSSTSVFQLHHCRT
jgi:outer membrane protein W